MSLNLTFIVQGHTASGWESFRLYMATDGQPFQLLYRSGSNVQVFHISTVNRDAGSSWFFGQDGGELFSDARVIHASIRVHPGWWVGYLSCSPWDDLLEVMVGDRFVPRGRGVRIPSGDTNPAVFWHPTI
jgi:hypothetical protein